MTTPDLDPRDRLMRLATYFSVAAGLTLIGVKLAAWMATGSVALLSTLVDSTIDAAASLLNLAAVRQALQPADKDHRFGHGKAEPLAGLGQAAFITGSACFLVSEASTRLLHPSPVSNPEIGIAVMVFSVVVTGVLVFFQRMVVKRTKSLAVDADKLHYTGDLLMNLSVIVSLLLSSQFDLPLADPLFALGIAGFLVYGAVVIAWRSLHLLMDHEFPETDRQQILAICRSHPAVLDIHDLRTRSAGLHSFIQLHLVLDAEISLIKAHAISDEVEANIRAAFSFADVIIHQDPAGVNEPPPAVP